MRLDRARVRSRLVRLASRLPVPPTHTPPNTPARVLVIRPDDIGDLVLASPALVRLRAGLPQATLTLAVGPWSRAAADLGPTVDHILPIPFPGVSRAARYRLGVPYLRLLQEARHLRRARFDAAIILRPDHWWGAMLAWAAGIPRRFGSAHLDVARFCTDVVPTNPRSHAAAHNLILVDALLGTHSPVDPLTAPLVVRITDDARRQAGALLGSGGDDRPRIGIHPGAGGTIKQWSTDRWIAVTRVLVADGAAVVLTGSPSERALTQPIATAVAAADVRDLAGRTNLATLAAVLSTCDLVVGVDSGALHIATAVSRRTVRIYGPSNPVEFGPWGDPLRHQALWAGFQCPLCGVLDRATPCLPDCMGAVTPEQVIRAARALLRVP